jgi:hypothetical protein
MNRRADGYRSPCVTNDWPAAGLTLYARLWTKVDGIWRSSDSSFTAAPVPATLTYRLDGGLNVDQSRPITWTNVVNVQAYYLYVGTTPGAKDLVNGETRYRPRT